VLAANDLEKLLLRLEFKCSCILFGSLPGKALVLLLRLLGMKGLEGK